jgi:hypothetical protein
MIFAVRLMRAARSIVVILTGKIYEVSNNYIIFLSIYLFLYFI